MAVINYSARNNWALNTVVFNKTAAVWIVRDTVPGFVLSAIK